MRTVPARLVVALTVVCLIVAWSLAACGGQQAQLPQVEAQAVVGPGSGEATINLTSSGEGTGVAEIVVEYPDGQSKVFGNGVLEAETSLGFSRQDLPAGEYRYTVYAVATATPPADAAFPANAQSQDNVVASGGFTID